MATIDLPIAQITEGPRIRQEYDEIEELAGDIYDNGLIQPIVVWPDPTKAGKYRLLVGGRRLAAIRLLGWPTIQAQVNVSIKDEVDARLVELAENIMRRDFNNEEKVEAGLGLEELLGPAALKRQKATRFGGGGLSDLDVPWKGRTDEFIAHKLGMGKDSWRHAREIYLIAKGDPDNTRLQKLKEGLAKNLPIDPLWQELQRYIIGSSITATGHEYIPAKPPTNGHYEPVDNHVDNVDNALSVDLSTGEIVGEQTLNTADISRFYDLLQNITTAMGRFIAAEDGQVAAWALSDLRHMARQVDDRATAALKAVGFDAWRLHQEMFKD